MSQSKAVGFGSFVLLFALLGFPSYAAETAPAAEKASSPAPETPAPSLTSSGNVTVDFKDADIQNVLRAISLKSGVNIVAGKDVVGSVTIRLVDVPWEKALDVVLKTYGYGYDRDGNIVRVTTLENLKKGELSTEVYTLNYSQAEEVQKSVKDMLSDRGRSRFDARSNTLIVTDMPTILQNVEKVVSRLDRITPQVLIQAKVIEMTLGDADRLGIKWNISTTISGASRPTTFPFTQPDQAGLDRLRQYLPEGDVPSQKFPNLDYTHQATFPYAQPSDFLFGKLNFSQLQAVLDLIQNRKDAKVLSEPHIVTLNNKEAKILVGDIISIPLFERNITTGKMEITGYTNKDVGVRLLVTPSVNDQNEIVVSVHPEITTLVGYDDITADIKAPHFTSREALTQIRVNSGETIAIGGLIKEDKTTTKTKVPVLGDLPLIDRLFKHNDTTVNKTDLLFFMTVHVVNEKALPQGHPTGMDRI